MTDNRKKLETEYRKLAKRADQRLVRLEAYSYQYKGVLNYAYAKALHDIRNWSGENAKRFNTKPPANTNQLRAKIKDIETFLNSETSTLIGGKKDETKGILNVYKNRANTLNKKYGMNLTWKQLANFFEKGLFEKLDTTYDSGAAFEILNTYKANQKEILDQIKRGEEIHVTVDDDKMLEWQTNKFLNENGIDSFDKLFRG